MIAVVDSYPIDESPYGVRGMAGNTACWCGNRFSSAADPQPGERIGIDPLPDEVELASTESRAVRGGVWHRSFREGFASFRNGTEPQWRDVGIGIRLARSWPVGG